MKKYLLVALVLMMSCKPKPAPAINKSGSADARVDPPSKGSNPGSNPPSSGSPAPAPNDPVGGQAKTTEAHIFTLRELAPPSSLRVIDEVELAEHFKDPSKFLATEADSDSEEESDECSEMYSTVKIVAQGDTATVDSVLDSKECMQKMVALDPNLAQTVSKSTFSLYMKYTCKGANFSVLNGKSFASLATSLNCKSVATLLLNTEIIVDIKNKETGEISSSTSRSATSNAENEACTQTFANNTFSDNSCVSIELTRGTGIFAANDSYERLVAKGLVWSDSKEDSWFSAGSMDMTIFNWKGSLTYKGASIEPVYTMTQGSKTVTGHISLSNSTRSFALKAVKTAPKKISLPVKTHSILKKFGIDR